VRCEIDQLLVDEFQDTDRVQCEIVSALALEGDAAERPSLFLVGDPKQSVYGWRNADVAAYLRFVERARAPPGAEKHALCVNHRSVPAVLDEVERVIALILREEPGVQPPLSRLSRATGALRSSAPAARSTRSSTGGLNGGMPTRAGSRRRHRRPTVALEARPAADLLRLRSAASVEGVGVLLRSTGDLDRYSRRCATPRFRTRRSRPKLLPAARGARRRGTRLRRARRERSGRGSVTLRSAWWAYRRGVASALGARLPASPRVALDGHADSLARSRHRARRRGGDRGVPGIAALVGWEGSLCMRSR
jgi:hypothetical protein